MTYGDSHGYVPAPKGMKSNEVTSHNYLLPIRYFPKEFHIIKGIKGNVGLFMSKLLRFRNIFFNL